MLDLQHLLYDKRDVPIAGIGEYGNMKYYAAMMNERLKYLRKESRITQNQLAQFLSVDRNMVTKLENGTRSSSTTMIDKICGLFLDERQ